MKPPVAETGNHMDMDNQLINPVSTPVTFPTDYGSVLERIDQISPIEYGRTRNFVDGAVTYLSPYISRGVISVKQVQEIILAKGFAYGTIVKFLQELAWREYFQRVWQAKGDSLFDDLKHAQRNVAHQGMIDGITNAATGIDALDHSIQQFYQTGYLHNHVRMYIASVTCNIGKAHWFTPSRWMYAHLLDGDLASNTCSWQWVAGSFARQKYYCNQENINRFTHGSQQGTYLDAPVDTLERVAVPPELKEVMPWHLHTRLPSFTAPRIDDTKPTLIYNSYNLDPMWRKAENVNRVLLLEPSHFEKYPVSEKVMQFIVSLAGNIEGIQMMTGEVSDLLALYRDAAGALIYSKEHPGFDHYPGVKDERDWIYPQVTGFYPSFFSFWKRCGKQLGVPTP